jgi:hypothetical protein
VKRAAGANDLIEPREILLENHSVEKVSAFIAWFCVDAAT